MNETQLTPKISIIMPLKDGEAYLPLCLNALKRQTLGNYELIIFDNASTDNGINIIKNEFPQAKIISSDKNYFVGGAVNRALPYATGEYILVLCVDVILNNDFLQKAVILCESDQKIGALQAKTLKFDLTDDQVIKTDIIDTTGFIIFKNGRIINRGHGEKDTNQFIAGPIFSYEGAAPFFKKSALEDAKINGELFDEDFKWMAEDIDLGWRLTNLGWKNYYSPELICWHDRKTTKRLSKGKFDFIKLRRAIPKLKRRLDFQNIILTYIKNLFWSNFFRHFFAFVLRQTELMLYIIFLEPSSVPALFTVIRLLPKMLRKRREIMRRRKITAREIELWLN